MKEEYEQYLIDIYPIIGGSLAQVYLDDDLVTAMHGNNEVDALAKARRWIDIQSGSSLTAENAALRGRVNELRSLLERWAAYEEKLDRLSGEDFAQIYLDTLETLDTKDDPQ